MLETKHDELHLACVDLRKDHEALTETVTQLQSHLEDLDNRNRRNNIRVRGVPKTVVDLPVAVTAIFHSLLPEHADRAFTCDRIHRALRPKPPPEKPPAMCLKDFIVKEEILRASRTTPVIRHEGLSCRSTGISPQQPWIRGVG